MSNISTGRKTGDYHDDMNFENFQKWVTTQLLPNLPPRSVLVVDNASYHNVTLDKCPTSASLKSTMIRWLVERNIPHDPKMFKPELYEIIKIHKPKFPRYALDTLLHQHGHTALRLPPYHPELNPIEKIWANVKNWVAARNVTFKLQDVRNLAIQKFDSITAAEWSAVCDHVDKIVNEYVERENAIDEALESLQFKVNTNDSDDSNESSEENLSDNSDAENILPIHA